MTEITLAALKEDNLVFDNSHDPSLDAFSVELEFHQITTWDNPFKLFVNEQLKASFKTFASLKKNAEKLINDNELQAV